MAKRGRPRKIIQPSSPPGVLHSRKLKIKTDIDSQNEPNVPKKRGRKAKLASTPEAASKTTEELESESVKNSDSFANAIQDEANEETDRFDASDLKLEGDRLSSLRQRKSETVTIDPEPGPSHKEDPAEFSDAFEDEYNLDDSDSDPTWTGSASKLADPLKRELPPGGSVVPPKKRGPKSVKKSPRDDDDDQSPPPKRKKSSERKVVPSITIVRAKPSVKKDKPKKESFKELLKREKKKKDSIINNKKMKKDKVPDMDQFLIAKTDLGQARPYIWKLDKKTHMLQRFEVIEQNGALIYQSSFTYAAWNQFSVSQYVSANVEVLTRTPYRYIVKLLGPDNSEYIDNAISSSSNQQASSTTKDGENSEGETEKKTEENFDHLKENFDIFLQSLISQAVDSNFLSEVHRENDEYFLINIKVIESVSEAKRNKIVNDFWDEELKTSADTYPCVNVLDNIIEKDECQVCKKNKGTHLLQFYGQPYDPITLAAVIKTLSLKTQFFVCPKCATAVSLYNRLLHQKYNCYIKCRSKLNVVRGNRDRVESHILLGDCLEDHRWVNILFEELIHLWRTSERNS